MLSIALQQKKVVTRTAQLHAFLTQLFIQLLVAAWRLKSFLQTLRH